MLLVRRKKTIRFTYDCLRTVVGAGGKFVNGTKVLSAVPSISQPRRVDRELHESEDRLETDRKQLSAKTEIQYVYRNQNIRHQIQLRNEISEQS